MKQNTKEGTSLEERKEAELVVVKLENAFSKYIKDMKARETVANTKYSKL